MLAVLPGRKESCGCALFHTVQLCDLPVSSTYSRAPAWQGSALHACVYCPAVPAGSSSVPAGCQLVSNLITSIFLHCFSVIFPVEGLNQHAGPDFHGCSGKFWLDWCMGIRAWDLFLPSVRRAGGGLAWCLESDLLHQTAKALGSCWAGFNCLRFC